MLAGSGQLRGMGAPSAGPVAGTLGAVNRSRTESRGDAGGGPAAIDTTRATARMEKRNKLRERIGDPPNIETRL
jgi:hypothetical protein